jgi:alcohol dehydrogenase (cytochrome c)
MRFIKKAALWGSICGVIAVGVFTAVHWDSISWRLQLYQRKLGGGLGDLSWKELVEFTAGRDRFAIGRPISEGRSIEAAVTNPYTSTDDHRLGAQLFHARCIECHGNDASGGAHGPSLLRPTFDHGDSDFAVYKVLRDGILGTPMAPTHLSFDERWRLVGYLRTLQHRFLAKAARPAPEISVTAEDIRFAGQRTDQWLTYSGSLNGMRFTPLAQITAANVNRLRLKWVRQLATEATITEATPLVINGVMYFSEPVNNVVALDVRTGALLWRVERELPADLPVCCGRVNRGLAARGGALFLGTLDGHLLALDASTGNTLWDATVADPSKGYSITVAPLAFRDSVVVGISGGEYGIRGFLAAYDVHSGKQQWKFYTIPAPGEPGHESWQNDAWRTGGGPTWVTGSYDPEHDLLYWGVGNPAPDYQGAVRPGDNLYTDSVIALHAASGRLAWHFQFTPHDEHDWDSNQTPILTDLVVRGTKRQVICWANRNGFYYVLDRVTGEFLTATAFSKLNWASGTDSRGRPILTDSGQVTMGGALTYPGVGGATNWQPPAFNPKLGSIFIPANEQGSVFTKTAKDEVERGQQGLYVGSGAANSTGIIPFVRSLDAATGKRRWEYASPLITRGAGGFTGLLATGGGLVFGASGGTIFALDAASGKERWRLFLGGNTFAPPISFTIDGRQVIAIAAGRAMFVFEPSS